MSACKACWLLILIIYLVVISGCTGSSRDSLPQDKYTAIQEGERTGATIIEGSYNLPAHITPGGVFIFDGSGNGSNWADGSSWSNNDRFLDSGYYPVVNDSFKALYGATYYRDIGPSDTKMGIEVKGIYGFPYTFHAGFVLQSIDANGTIRGTYNNTSIVLRSGEQWVSPVLSVIKSSNGTGLDGKPFSYMARFDTTWTITNLGVHDKTNLTGYNNSATDTGYVWTP
jgi:hypothetical protein